MDIAALPLRVDQADRRCICFHNFAVCRYFLLHSARNHSAGQHAGQQKSFHSGFVPFAGHAKIRNASGRCKYVQIIRISINLRDGQIAEIRLAVIREALFLHKTDLCWKPRTGVTHFTRADPYRYGNSTPSRLRGRAIFFVICITIKKNNYLYAVMVPARYAGQDEKGIR